jgi:hypothetical protein
MGLTTAEEIILIILAAALAIAIILLIIVLVFVLKLVNRARKFVEKAELIVESVGSVGEIFKSATGPFAVFKFLRNLIDMVQKHKG